MLDTSPRSLTKPQQSGLEALARQVVAQLELRRLHAQRELDEVRHRLIIETAIGDLFPSARPYRLSNAVTRGAIDALPASSHPDLPTFPHGLCEFRVTGWIAYSEAVSGSRSDT